MYQIICQDGTQALRIQATDFSNFKKSKVIGTASNANDLSQLWMIEKLGSGKD